LAKNTDSTFPGSWIPLEKLNENDVIKMVFYYEDATSVKKYIPLF
jgi:hypothetical protein